MTFPEAFGFYCLEVRSSRSGIEAWFDPERMLVTASAAVVVEASFGMLFALGAVEGSGARHQSVVGLSQWADAGAGGSRWSSRSD